MARRLVIVGSGSLAERLAELAGPLGYDEIRASDDLPDDMAATDHVVIAAESPAEVADAVAAGLGARAGRRGGRKRRN